MEQLEWTVDAVTEPSANPYRDVDRDADGHANWGSCGVLYPLTRIFSAVVEISVFAEYIRTGFVTIATKADLRAGFRLVRGKCRFRGRVSIRVAVGIPGTMHPGWAS